jgi:hypothetical protein
MNTDEHTPVFGGERNWWKAGVDPEPTRESVRPTPDQNTINTQWLVVAVLIAITLLIGIQTHAPFPPVF